MKTNSSAFPSKTHLLNAIFDEAKNVFNYSTRVQCYKTFFETKNVFLLTESAHKCKRNTSLKQNYSLTLSIVGSYYFRLVSCVAKDVYTMKPVL